METLSGRYRLLEQLGQGGMALVYKAQDLLLERAVAVKLLREDWAADADFVARFRQEARAAARLSHPNIAAIYDVGEDAGRHYIVMEHLEGRSLKEELAQGPLNALRLVEVGAQVCAGLEYAHRKGIIHRDIKPHNVLLCGNLAKIVDFGIARALGAATHTQVGEVLGSPQYLSPEQVKGLEASPLSDVYSLGVVLYEAATGRLPFQSDSPLATALKHLNETPLPPRFLSPGVPASLEAIILKAMAKDPGQRYAGASQMGQALAQCLARSQEDTAAVRAIPVAPPGLRTAPATGSEAPPGLRTTPATEGIGSEAPPGLRTTPGTGGEPPSGLRTTPATGSEGPPGLRTTPATGSEGPLGLRTTPSAVEGVSPVLRTTPATGGRPPALRATPARRGCIEASPGLGGRSSPASRIAPATEGPGTAAATPWPPDKTARSRRPRPSRGSPWAPVMAFFGLVAVVAGLTLLSPVLVRRYLSTPAQTGALSPAPSPSPPSTSPAATSTPTAVPLALVPSVTGMLPQDARILVEGQGLKYVEGALEPSNDVPEGRVARQTPSPGGTVSTGSTMTVTISHGPAMVRVPAVTDLTYIEAEAALKAAGLRLAEKEVWHATVPAGRILQQEPPASTSVSRGSLVTLTVSKGREKVAVPNVVGVAEDKAQRAIQQAGLRNNQFVNYQGHDVLPNETLLKVCVGCVLSTTPASGEMVELGTEVRMAVRKD